MARIISLIVLVAILLVIAALFFQVMASFLLPMFVALVLVIVFRPLHGWLMAQCGGRLRLAAALTTIAVLLIVLLPLVLVILQAVAESISLYRYLDPKAINIQKLSALTVRLAEPLGLHLNADNVKEVVTGKLQEWLYPVARGTTQFLGQFLMGLVVMVISLYYFLADGPEMIYTLVRLAPLDERYQRQLIEQFENVSRAVVLATFLSAAAQGILAGLGLWIAGVPSIFLLIVVTMLLSVIPFVGPPAVWIGACAWLYFYDDRLTAAVALGIYGVLVVSTVDNIVRPAVLHGSSNLHPLLALLSVIGGVQAMGVLGIFVGPMVVVFLQTLLNILHQELQTMGKVNKATP